MPRKPEKMPNGNFLIYVSFALIMIGLKLIKL